MLRLFQKLVILSICLLGITTSVSCQTNNDSLWFNLGTDNFKQAKFNDAIYWFTKSIDVGYDIIDSYGLRGASETLINKPIDASRDIRYALSLDSNDAYLHFYLARLFMLLDQNDSAVMSLLKATILDSANPDFFDLLGVSYAKINKFDSALDFEKKALDKNSEDPDYLNNLGYIREQMGNYKEALNEFNIILRIKPKDPTASINVAFCKYKLKLFSEAISICDEVLIQHPDFGYAYYIRSQIYYETGNKNNACNDVKKLNLVSKSAAQGLIEKYACPD